LLEKKQILWIDWGRHLRTQTLSRRLGVGLQEISFDGPRFWRYYRSALRTLSTIQDKRPDVVIATVPSIVLGFLLLVLRGWYGFRLVSDAHYLGVKAVDDSRLLQALLNFLNSRVDLVIVTNDSHARFLTALGARTYVCQDPLPEIPVSRSIVNAGERSVLLIASFDTDEPYEAAFEAFAGLRTHGVTLLVSGNYKKAQGDLSRFPWVRLLGFLPTDEYYAYLRSASVIMDLTTLEDCLVCGAYEALAAEKPLVVSKTTALREYFGDSVILTDNTPKGIEASVLRAFEQRDELVHLARTWVSRNQAYMDGRIAGLRAAVSGSVAPREVEMRQTP
jgi:glycosyltransferase involved in cell wall biosynthesis